MAIVILAVVLPVALAGVSAATRSAGEVQKREVARRLAESRLARLLAEGSWSTASGSGTFDAATDGDNATGMRWTLAVAAWREPTVKTITLTVAWGADTDTSRTVTLTTMAVP